MAKPTKAQISYKVGTGKDAVDQVIRFHGVKAEEHEASSEITGFPTQDGFQVSNHAIKKNRKVSLTVYVTNHLVVGAEEFHEYGSNNVKVMFSTLQQLVNQAIPCDVATNWGNYTPVVFNRFKTKLVAGKTDMMEVTMIGQELQVGTALNGNKPKLLTFTILSDEERAARVKELLAAGLEVPDEAVISEANVDLNESFQVETTGTNGETQLTTYEKTSYDPTTNTHGHTVHTSDTAIAEAAPTSTFNWNVFMQESDLDLAAGASTTAACLKDGLTGIANDARDEAVNTAIGVLSESVHGAIAQVMALAGDSPLGQALFALGLDCLIAGAVGSVDPDLNADDFQDNELASVDEVLNGATAQGNAEATDAFGKVAPTTLTKISPPDGGDLPFFGDVL